MRKEKKQAEIKAMKDLLDTGLTKLEVAKKIGCHKSSVARYTNGYKPKISARDAQKIRTEKRYRKMVKACENHNNIEVGRMFKVSPQTVQKAKFKYGNKEDKQDVVIDDTAKIEIEKLIKRGYDEYEIITMLSYEYGKIKKSVIAKIRASMPSPRLGFMGMMA